jgi:putative redox protein
MTVRWYALQQKWPLEKVEVNLSHQKIKAAELPDAAGKTGMVDVFEKEVIVYGNALTADQRQKLIDVAAKCPVQRSLQSGVLIHTKG